MRSVHHTTCFGMTRQLLIEIQWLTNTSHYFSRYNIKITNWDLIENSIHIPDVTFARLAAANFHYSLFEKLVEGLSPLSIFNIPEDPVIDIHYGQYGKFVTGLHSISDCNRDKKDVFDIDENNNGGIADDKVIDNNNN